MSTKTSAWRKQRGFTMVELIIVISVTSALAIVVSGFITSPIKAYVDQVRRAELVDAGESAIRRLARDIRHALPNSLRISGSGKVLELVNAVEAVRYRDDPMPADSSADHYLDFISADTSFNILGRFSSLGYGSQPASTRLVIYNLGQTGADIYAGDAIVTPTGTTLSLSDAGDEDRFTLNPAFQFAIPSPAQRLYVVDTPVTFICDTAAKNMLRYQDYPITASASSVDTNSELLALGASSALVTTYIKDCSFSYFPGTSESMALVSVSITLEDLAGEQVQMLHQVHVSNAP